jgi:hypothetical protein
MGISEIALTGGLVLLGISLLLIAVFGIKNIVSGKHELSKIAVVVTPFVIFGITYGVTGQLTESALITLLTLIGLMLLLILFGGVRSSFKF